MRAVVEMEGEAPPRFPSVGRPCLAKKNALQHAKNLTAKPPDCEDLRWPHRLPYASRTFARPSACHTLTDGQAYATTVLRSGRAPAFLDCGRADARRKPASEPPLSRGAACPPSSAHRPARESGSCVRSSLRNRTPNGTLRARTVECLRVAPHLIPRSRSLERRSPACCFFSFSSTRERPSATSCQPSLCGRWSLMGLASLGNAMR